MRHDRLTKAKSSGSSFKSTAVHWAFFTRYIQALNKKVCATIIANSELLFNKIHTEKYLCNLFGHVDIMAICNVYKHKHGKSM